MNKAIANLVSLTPAQSVRLHNVIRGAIPRPALCPECGMVEPTEMANVTGVYDFDLKNWRWLCKWCHMLRDGTLGMQEIEKCRIKKIMAKTVFRKRGRPRKVVQPK